MATTFSNATPAAATSVISAAQMYPASVALASNKLLLGPVITPGTNPPLFTQMLLTATYAVAPAASTVVGKGWFIEAVDGTNYDAHGAASDATLLAPARAPDFVFVWPNIASQAGPYVLQATPLVAARPANLFKVLYQNTSQQAHSNASATNLQESTLNEIGV